MQGRTITDIILFVYLVILSDQYSPYLKKKMLLILKRFLASNLSGSKDLHIVISSLRIDRILATGLAIGRRFVCICVIT